MIDGEFLLLPNYVQSEIDPIGASRPSGQEKVSFQA